QPDRHGRVDAEAVVRRRDPCVTTNPPVLVPLSTRRPTMSVTTSCHGPGGGAGAGAGSPIIALVGAPNVGKSTLFNALTGLRVTMGNWPGTTVDVARGVWRTTGTRTCDCETCTCGPEAAQELTLIDLPGAYSLDPMSPDEALTRDLLVACPPEEAPDVTVVAVDAAHLSRSLYLVSQLREQPLRMVVALTMVDVARSRGIAVDTDVLSERLGCPVVVTHPRLGRGIDELTVAVRRALDGPASPPREVTDRPDAILAPMDADLVREDERFSFIEAAVEAATHDSGERRASLSDNADRWLTAPIAGPLAFRGVRWVVFQLTTTVAAPLQGWLDALFSGPLSSATSWVLVQVGLGGSWVEGLLVDGLVAGVGMLLTFAPLMAIMFVLLALLEDSGYMARAAVVTDRLMRSIGLPGRAFLPLVVGFGCNVPAISATRVLPNVRQRILTALLVPFTSCSARLTVYVLVATVFFGRWAGTVVFSMYLVSIGFVVGVGLLLRKTLWRTMGAEPLVLDLPPYQRPTLRLTASVTWVRLKGFLQTAGGIIVATVCAVWLLQAIPTTGEGSFGAVPVEDSVYGVTAQAISPVFAPAGFDQWQTTSALVVGFVAKEAVISSWAQTYAVEEPVEGEDPGTLGEHIRADFTTSSGGHPLPAVLAFMVFLLAYTPCVATLAAQKREIGMKWTIFGVAMQLVVAWVAAVAVFQVGRLFW
ncbi:MAG TPA: ferrous iron transport protein B, partial [Propionibacteriaceae bacterium]|nr:ferrous iron transport protein B [Propionibacteriaceae bacterium]